MTWRAGALVAGLLLASGCASADPEPTTAAGGNEETSSASASSATPSATETADASAGEADDGTRIVVDSSDFGPMLYSAEGQAIYLFDLEGGPRPRCYGECAVEWPPVLTEGDPVAGRGVRSALLGTVERRDGSTQLTYGGHPLYFYAHEGPHEVLCHDFFEYGGTWYVVQPTGDAAPA